MDRHDDTPFRHLDDDIIVTGMTPHNIMHD